jgi:hypothetical protein
VALGFEQGALTSRQSGNTDLVVFKEFPARLRNLLVEGGSIVALARNLDGAGDILTKYHGQPTYRQDD